MDSDNILNEFTFDPMQKDIREQFELWLSFKGIGGTDEKYDISDNILNKILSESEEIYENKEFSPQNSCYDKKVHYDRFDKYCKSNK